MVKHMDVLGSTNNTYHVQRALCGQRPKDGVPIGGEVYARVVMGGVQCKRTDGDDSTP